MYVYVADEPSPATDPGPADNGSPAPTAPTKPSGHFIRLDYATLAALQHATQARLEDDVAARASAPNESIGTATAISAASYYQNVIDRLTSSSTNVSRKDALALAKQTAAKVDLFAATADASQLTKLFAATKRTPQSPLETLLAARALGIGAAPPPQSVPTAALSVALQSVSVIDKLPTNAKTRIPINDGSPRQSTRDFNDRESESAANRLNDASPFARASPTETSLNVGRAEFSTESALAANAPPGADQGASLPITGQLNDGALKALTTYLNSGDYQAGYKVLSDQNNYSSNIDSHVTQFFDFAAAINRNDRTSVVSNVARLVTDSYLQRANSSLTAQDVSDRIAQNIQRDIVAQNGAVDLNDVIRNDMYTAASLLGGDITSYPGYVAARLGFLGDIDRKKTGLDQGIGSLIDAAATFLKVTAEKVFDQISNLIVGTSGFQTIGPGGLIYIPSNPPTGVTTQLPQLPPVFDPPIVPPLEIPDPPSRWTPPDLPPIKGFQPPPNLPPIIYKPPESDNDPGTYV